jgi:hypothetical protein
MTHDQIRAMVRRVNPIPDPRALETVAEPVPVTPPERRLDMQTDSRETTEDRGRNRRRSPIIGTAAALVILMGGLLFVLTRDNTPATVAAPNATEIQDAEDPLAPGAYFVATGEEGASSIRGTFVIEGSGWTEVSASGAMKALGEEYVALLIVEVDGVYSQPCEMSGRGPAPAGSTASDLANQFAANGFTVREALAPVNAFGHDGHHLVTEVPAGCANDMFQVWTSGTFDSRFYQADGQMVEYWFLDVEGTPVMVEASWFPSSPEEDIAELREVLDTLVITP